MAWGNISVVAKLRWLPICPATGNGETTTDIKQPTTSGMIIRVNGNMAQFGRVFERMTWTCSDLALNINQKFISFNQG